MRLTRSFAPLLLLSALLMGCTNSGSGDDFDYTTCGVRPRVVLPVQMRGDIPLVQATIGDRPATFVLDTGSVGVVLTQAALNRLALTTDNNKVLSGIGVGGTVHSFAGNLKGLKIQGLPVPDHEVQVLPASSAIAAQGTVDGLFGVSVLSVFEVDLDLPRRQVTLYAGRLCPSTVVPTWNFPYSTIPADHSTNGRFVIPVELDGHALSAMLDTGAARSVVSRDVAHALGISDATLEQGPRATLIGTGPNRPSAYAHRFREIKLGDMTYESPVLFVTDAPEPTVDMILGSDYLGSHRLWLSYARKRVFLGKSEP